MSDPLQADRAYLAQLRGVFANPEQQDRYVADSLGRIGIVLDLVDTLAARGVHRILELGANPYMMTLLMRRRFAFDASYANYFGESAAPPESVHTVEIAGERLQIPFKHFNIERERFPYADGSFDCVLFCEILEHLLLSADRPIEEIARILRPGGFVVLSTPNATRLQNLVRLVRGESVWEGYSDNGAYGRHNREFTLAELQQLLRRHGLEPVRAEARNIHPVPRTYVLLQSLRPAVWRDHLFVIGQKTAATV